MMWLFHADGPCGLQDWTTLIIGILAAINVALNSWLVNRRFQADKREFVKDGCPLDQRYIDSGNRDVPQKRNRADE